MGKFDFPATNTFCNRASETWRLALSRLVYESRAAPRARHGCLLEPIVSRVPSNKTLDDYLLLGPACRSRYPDTLTVDTSIGRAISAGLTWPELLREVCRYAPGTGAVTCLRCLSKSSP